MRVGERVFFFLFFFFPRPSALSHLLPKMEGSVMLGKLGSWWLLSACVPFLSSCHLWQFPSARACPSSRAEYLSWPLLKPILTAYLALDRSLKLCYLSLAFVGLKRPTGLLFPPTGGYRDRMSTDSISLAAPPLCPISLRPNLPKR